MYDGIDNDEGFTVFDGRCGLVPMLPSAHAHCTKWVIVHRQDRLHRCTLYAL